LWASSRPAPDVAEARGAAEGGRPGSKRHAVTDADGVPLAVVLNAANIHDSAALEDLVDAVAPTEADQGSMTPKAPAGNKKAVWRTERRGKVSYPGLHSPRCPTQSENCHEKLGLVTAGGLDFPPTVSKYWRKL
jgi:Transposase DDE domain